MKIQASSKKYRLMALSTLIYLSILLLFSGIAWSAPVINSITTNSLSNGANVTISGSGFGSSGPRIVLFDDFENGQAGQTIKLGTGGAAYGGWNASGNPSTTYYTNSASISGSMAFQANMQNNYYSYLQANLPAGTSDIFVSWWLYLPAGDNFPGYNSGRVNWKQMWIQGSSTTDDDLVVPVALGTSVNNLANWLINGNESNPGYTKYTTVGFSRGQWKRLWVWIRGGANSNGQFHFWELTSSGVAQRINDNNVNTLKSGGYFERVRPNGYADTAANSHPTFDDIYIATGANARARVEIGNNASYMNCTRLAILTPVSWVDNQIVATVRTGSFRSNENAYLFVIDPNGVVSSGRAVTIGQASTSTTPSVPVDETPTQEDPSTTPESNTSSTSAWSANTQTGDSVWKNSGVTYCVRLLVQGSHVTQSVNQVRLAFQGRSSGNYTIRNVSIAERDTASSEGNVIDSTWKQITFDKAAWSVSATVAQNSEKLSDPVNINFKAGTDYYVTFKIDTPSVYLNPASTYRELFFISEDHTGDIDWAGRGFGIANDYHALSKIYTIDGKEVAAPGNLRIVESK